MVNVKSLATLVLGLGLSKLVQGGFLDDGCGYSNDGPQFTLRHDGTVTTYCNEKVCRAVTYSAINLNDCIANVLGELKPKPDNSSHGNFMKSCEDCFVDGSSSIRCKCKGLAGEMNETILDVNQVLVNWNGYLSCRGAISDCYQVKWSCKPKEPLDSFEGWFRRSIRLDGALVIDYGTEMRVQQDRSART